MSKFPRPARLSKDKRRDLIIFLCRALLSLKSEEEVAKFISDLLSPPEIEMVSKRLEVALLLIQGSTYQEIRNKLKVGFTTIARIQTWINKSGEGFKIALSRRKPIKEINIYSHDFQNQLKRKYPSYYWPEILLEKILAASDIKHQKIISNLVDSMLLP